MIPKDKIDKKVLIEAVEFLGQLLRSFDVGILRPEIEPFDYLGLFEQVCKNYLKNPKGGFPNYRMPMTGACLSYPNNIKFIFPIELLKDINAFKGYLTHEISEVKIVRSNLILRFLAKLREYSLIRLNAEPPFISKVIELIVDTNAKRKGYQEYLQAFYNFKSYWRKKIKKETEEIIFKYAFISFLNKQIKQEQ